MIFYIYCLRLFLLTVSLIFCNSRVYLVFGLERVDESSSALTPGAGAIPLPYIYIYIPGIVYNIYIYVFVSIFQENRVCRRVGW